MGIHKAQRTQSLHRFFCLHLQHKLVHSDIAQVSIILQFVHLRKKTVVLPYKPADERVQTRNIHKLVISTHMHKQHNIHGWSNLSSVNADTYSARHHRQLPHNYCATAK